MIFANPLLIPGPEAITPFPCIFLIYPLPFGAVVTSLATSPLCSQRQSKNAFNGALSTAIGQPSGGDSIKGKPVFGIGISI